MFADDEANDLILPNVTGTGRCRGKCPSAELARGSSGSPRPLPAGRLDSYRGSQCGSGALLRFHHACQPAEGHYSVARPERRQSLGKAHSPVRGRSSSSVTVLESRCCVPNQPSAPLLKSRQQKYSLAPNMDFSCSKQHERKMEFRKPARTSRRSDAFPSPAH